MKNIVNLTPHAININRHQIDTIEIPPSGTVARCDEVRTNIDSIDLIPVDVVSFGDVEGLPEPQENTVYIVSALVAARVPERRDVYMPGKAIRDDAGRVIGCSGLSQVPAPISIDPDAPYPDLDPWDDMGAPSPSANAYLLAKVLAEVAGDLHGVCQGYGAMPGQEDYILWGMDYDPQYVDAEKVERYRRAKSLMDALLVSRD